MILYNLFVFLCYMRKDGCFSYTYNTQQHESLSNKSRVEQGGRGGRKRVHLFLSQFPTPVFYILVNTFVRIRIQDYKWKVSSFFFIWVFFLTDFYRLPVGRNNTNWIVNKAKKPIECQFSEDNGSWFSSMHLKRFWFSYKAYFVIYP